MNRIVVELENCYGIKKLNYTFDFSNLNAYAIYAPNGSMKSSFAETFKDIVEKRKSRDRMFPHRNTIRTIANENGTDLLPETILVLPPYDQFFSHSEKTSTLLVNNPLREEYEELHIDIEKCKSKFLDTMKNQSDSKKSLVEEIASAFTKKADERSFYHALERIESELKKQTNAPFANVKYDVIFDDKVLAVLNNEDLKSAIQDYIVRYNQLLDSSNYFKKGVFEYYNAAQIAKTLESNGFFDAKHAITLNALETKEIRTSQQLEEIVADELKAITNDQKLRAKLEIIKKQLERNVQLREFQKYLCNNEMLLPHLSNIGDFKENIWKSYFKENELLYDELLAKFRQTEARRTEIEEEASKERTLWEEAIALFNERFFVPFTLEATNKAAVMLGNEAILNLGYTFHDETDDVRVEHKDLLESLSQGERKALYILNIIFEIQVRKNNQQDTLFVIDDIADSFDYKNKYAIIQYLQDISEYPIFKQIILTHNFDFFRTVNSRFVGYKPCLMAVKNTEGIALRNAVDVRNPFINNWKGKFYDSCMKRVASISFIRNIIEYTRGDSDKDYLTLTSLLHWKKNTNCIKQSNLDDIFQGLFGGNGRFNNENELVVDMINREATNCLNSDEIANLEHKVVLSIAIRLFAERYMINVIDDTAFVETIEKNQTQKLLKRYESEFPNNVESVNTLRKVVLMTPENIHLNAFMYEPILDMSDESLKSLYLKVSSLS